MGRSRRIALFGVLAIGALACAWVLAAPDPAVRVPPLHPPHPVRTAQPARPPAPDDEPPAEETPAPAQNDGPTRRDLEAGMEQVKKQVWRCHDVEQFQGLLNVHLVITRAGSVQSAQVLPPLDKTETATCVVRAVKQASFARFRGAENPTVELTWPFFFRPDGLL